VRFTAPQNLPLPPWPPRVSAVLSFYFGEADDE
jgi:hypothetical protein